MANWLERYIQGLDSHHKARLVGGLFDGDRGLIPDPVEAIFAYACGEPRRVCQAGNGVHWVQSLDDVPPDIVGEPVRYELDPESPDEHGVYVYVFPDLSDPDALLRDKHLVEA